MATVNVNVDIDLSELEDDIYEEYCNKDCCLCPEAWEDKTDEIKELIAELEKELYVYTTKSNITIEDVIRKLKNIIE